ncbi:MAG: winged helix-turn-helix transcriptional regulator [Candidatus Bathyarchaeia archaeon]|jgi:DNA-binding Lrp family transcriptional regulator
MDLEREKVLKDVELRLVSQLMKNSRRSDRELAKVLHVSQPTVSRAIKKLEKQGLIKEYTIVPDFTMLGFELMALTFISIKPTLDLTEASEARKLAEEKVKESPRNIMMLEKGIGLNHTGVVITFHKNYSAYTRFIQTFREAQTTQAYVDENVESFLIDLKDKIRYRPLTLAALADHILKMNKEKE